MSSNLVIVAIPDKDDRVWQISSEKIPHLTLLFLGDAEKVANLDQIMLFVEHAASTSLKRFYLPVDHRGELGDDKADVLFFKKGRYDFAAVREFRSLLLKDTNIKTAYDSATQFEAPQTTGLPGQPWIPHLTLGYPSAPAKSLPDGELPHFYDVNFTKIAVWTGNFEGPEFLLKDYWEDFDEMDVPLNIAMSALSHAKVSDTPWSQFKDSDYDDAQYARACLLDRGEAAGTAKQRYGLPVREPDGTVNRNACHAAAAVLSSVGGTGSARGSKVKGTPEQIAAAKKKLISLYKNTLEEDVPEGLGGEMKQTLVLGANFVEHYGVKGMRWGVHKSPQEEGGKREGIQRYLDPQGHELTRDVAKVGVGIILPVVAPLTWPAQIRMIRGGVRGIKAKQLDDQEKQFAKNAMSPQNFAAIHNGSLAKANPAVSEINKKYPNPNESPSTRKQYDAEVLKVMQDAYRESANSLVNKANTMHLDVEFHNNSDEFKIHARQGPGTPLRERIEHATEDDLANEEITVEITGKIKRDRSGHILGLEFDHLNQSSAIHAAELGEEFLEHFGVKGMKWGVRRAAQKVRQGARAVGRGLAALGAHLADSSWQSSVYSDMKHEAVHNHVAQKLDNHIERLQRSPKYRGKDLKADSDLRKEYYQDVAKVTSSAYRSGVKETYGENYTGTKSAHYVTDARGPRIEVRDKHSGETMAESPLTSMREIKKRRAEEAAAVHAATTDLPDLSIDLTLDGNGQISGVGFVKPSEDDALAQGQAFVLEHFGVKGMHWGVRKAPPPPPTAVNPSATSVVPHGTKRKTKIEVEGGENHPAHEDAVRVAEAKAKLKKSGTAALSNQELREMANRLQLENQVAILTSSRGKDFVSKEFEKESQRLIKRGAKAGAKAGAKKYGPTVAKKAGKAAATAATIAVL